MMQILVSGDGASPVDEIKSTFNQAHELCDKLSDMVSRMIGEATTGETPAISRYHPGGILGELATSAEELSKHISSAMSDIERLNRHLPARASQNADLSKGLMGVQDLSSLGSQIRAR